MGEQRDFKGVWIPRSIYLDSRLTALEKIVLVEIDSLDGDDGCFCSNEYLANFCQCSERKISDAVSKLIELGYITSVSFDGRKRVLRSRVEKTARQNSKNCEADEDTHYINNNKNNNIKTFSKEKVCSADAQRVIDAWNVLPSVPKVQRIMPTSSRYKMLIARVRDYGVDDVLRAIENIKKSPFLLGDNRRGWQITFDWFVKPNNFPKVLDGNYTKGVEAVVEESNIPKRRLTAEEVDNMEGYY